MATLFGSLLVVAVLIGVSARWATAGRVAVLAAVVVLMGILLLPQEWVLGVARQVPGVADALGFGWFDQVAHFVLFLAMGCVFGVFVRSTAGLVLVCGLAIALEVLQWGSAGHQVRMMDGLMNLAGGVVGFGMGRWFGVGRAGESGRKRERGAGKGS
ncbi:hypothetical protein HFP89_14840 [Wenzhouxiangella sp. XN79A]|uniref:hypothetical protein n=1 Tax=Wenzhouxiangella sp. XN79A TaxID=2724193 RepID=UPI00144AD871|nr:hypothetical protein [Wenzhouxiangella sp. XN79A]NKI36445.1 hypothetical protein [Wenzhouxiangella sp. XN79A]